MLQDYSNREIHGDLFFPSIPVGKLIGIGEDSRIVGLDMPEIPPGRNQWAIANNNTQMTTNTNYLVAGNSEISLLLPTNAVEGDTILIAGQCEWKITQNAGDSIRYGGQVTTAGTSGFIESSAIGDSVGIVYAGNGRWIVYSFYFATGFTINLTNGLESGGNTSYSVQNPFNSTNFVYQIFDSVTGYNIDAEVSRPNTQTINILIRNNIGITDSRYKLMLSRS